MKYTKNILRLVNIFKVFKIFKDKIFSSIFFPFTEGGPGAEIITQRGILEGGGV